MLHNTIAYDDSVNDAVISTTAGDDTISVTLLMLYYLIIIMIVDVGICLVKSINSYIFFLLQPDPMGIFRSHGC